MTQGHAPVIHSRRLCLALIGAAAVLAACALPPARQSAEPMPPPAVPIVFVHGNGDTAALWQTTLWRFESQGWPRERLHAIDLPYLWRATTTARPSQAARPAPNTWPI